MRFISIVMLLLFVCGCANRSTYIILERPISNEVVAYREYNPQLITGELYTYGRR